MARSKIAKISPTRKDLIEEEPLNDHDFDALPEEEESTAAEIHELIEREKDDFISLEEYCKRRGIKF